MSITVDRAVSTIKSNLDQGVLDWDVTHGELIENNKKVAELTPEQRNELFKKLSDDDLKNWTQEIDGANGSLSASERQDLFNKLAEGLDGQQLARLVKAFDGSIPGREALGNAIAQHASPEAKVAFIEATKGSIDGEYKATQGRDGNAETVAIAKALGSLKDDPAAFDKAINSLNNDQLAAVMTVGLGRTYVGSPNAPGRYFFEPSATLGILDAAAASGDLRVKGRVFSVATQQYNLVEGLPAEQPFTDGLTRLVKSDPNGLVQELRTRTDTSGDSMVTYLQKMLESGKTQEVKDLLIQMQQGNDGKGNALEYFSDPKNARNLGYFSGAIAGAINNMSADTAAQANLLKTIFVAGYGATGAVNPPAGVLASVGNGVTSVTIDNVVSDVQNGHKELKAAMYELAIPRNEKEEIPDSTSLDSFNSGYAAIAEANR